MKIVKDFNESMVFDQLEIKSASCIQDYKIDLLFSDNAKKSIDFEPFLKSSMHPSIAKYLNKELFKQFKIVDGNLNWNDYDMIFPLEDLYSGEIK